MAKLMILGLFRRDPRQRLIETLYARTVAAARQPGLYARLGVPDTVEGRFEALALHMVLMLRRLRGLPDPAGDVAQGLTDHFFAALDTALRESGVGDSGVPKRMKTLAQAFYGRARTYDAALDSHDPAELPAALARNVTGGPPAESLARYVRAAEATLTQTGLDALLRQGPACPDPDLVA
jgi:cytochrome b pre-mRNA-processing protein 3